MWRSWSGLVMRFWLRVSFVRGLGFGPRRPSWGFGLLLTTIAVAGVGFRGWLRR